MHQANQMDPSRGTAWRPAPQPDIVRAVQKDGLYLQQSIDACHDTVMRMFGAVPALQHAKSCRLLATFMYYATTTAAGLQTLGEEYCDILQISQQQPGSTSLIHQLRPAYNSSTCQGVPQPHVRVLLVLLQSLGPSLMDRLVASLDRASEQGTLPWEMGASLADFENSISSDAQQAGLVDSRSSGGIGTWDDGYGMQEQAHQHLHCAEDPGLSGSYSEQDSLNHSISQQQQQQPACSTLQQLRRRFQQHWHLLLQQLVPRWPAIKGWLLFAGRLHLASFYLHGNYYEWSKRLLGVHYTSISANKEQRASYRVLGWMLLVQLAISGLAQARSRYGPQHHGQQLDAIQGKTQHAVLLPDPVQPPAAAVETAGSNSAGHHVGRQCPLCLSARSHPACTPCGHVFCWHCIAQWCLEKPECPLCRTGVVTSQLVCLYHSDF